MVRTALLTQSHLPDPDMPALQKKALGALKTNIIFMPWNRKKTDKEDRGNAIINNGNIIRKLLRLRLWCHGSACKTTALLATRKSESTASQELSRAPTVPIAPVLLIIISDFFQNMLTREA